jgi:hypothetical protein
MLSRMPQLLRDMKKAADRHHLIRFIFWHNVGMEILCIGYMAYAVHMISFFVLSLCVPEEANDY